MSPRALRRVLGIGRAALGLALFGLLSLPAPNASAAGSADSVTITITPRDIWPPSPVTDLKAFPGAEGQMLLQWTAPDSNNYVFWPSSSPATSYQIKIASFSIAAVGNSTTTWWADAMDVTALQSPAISVTPPTPLTPGTTQTLLINQLWPGATYYAMLISRDQVGNVSESDLNSLSSTTQANALIFDAVPPGPTGVTAVALSSITFKVTWNPVGVYDLWDYKVYIDSTDAIPSNWTNSNIVLVASGTTFAIYTGKKATYSITVTAVDTGQPQYPGIQLESPKVSSTTIMLAGGSLAQEPFGVAISSGGGGVSLRWMPVVRFADFTPFVIPTAPVSGELSGYHVLRATSPVLGAWTDLITLSTATLTYVDLTGGPQYYYHIRAENDQGLSDHSVIRTLGSGAAYLVAPDDQSFFEIPNQDVYPIEGTVGNPFSAYLVTVSSHPSDLTDPSGRIIESLSFDAYQGGLTYTPTFSIAGMGMLEMHYSLNSSTWVSRPGVPATPSNLSVYWYNGTQWVQLFGTLDSLGQTVTIQTKFSGRYQLRTVERTGTFAFDKAGLSNRFITPNGDGMNDNAIFTFDNPNSASVTGKIFDRQGRLVVGSLLPGPTSNSLMWDGKANGRTVPSGVYIYVIQGEGQTYSGTLVIVK